MKVDEKSSSLLAAGKEETPATPYDSKTTWCALYGFLLVSIALSAYFAGVALGPVRWMFLNPSWLPPGWDCECLSAYLWTGKVLRMTDSAYHRTRFLIHPLLIRLYLMSPVKPFAKQMTISATL